MDIKIRWSDNTEELKKHLKEGLNQIEATRAGAAKMVQALSGTNLIQAAHNRAAAIKEIGGATKLTGAEAERASNLIQKAIDKYKALGQVAPQALHDVQAELKKVVDAQDDANKKTDALGAGFEKMAGSWTGSFTRLVGACAGVTLIDRAVSGLIDLGKAAISSAGALVDLSNKTGISIEQLQRFEAAGKTSGVSVDQFADAALKLGINLSSGSATARKALEELGLSYRQIMASKPDDQFNAIAAALEQVTDSQTRNRLAVELGGKTMLAILPAIADGYTDIAKNAKIAGEEQVRAIDAASDAWDNFLRELKTGITNWLGTQLLLRQALAAAAEAPGIYLRLQESTKTLDEFNAALIQWYLRQKDIPLVADKATTSTESYVAQLKEAQAALAKLTAADRAEIAPADQLGVSQDELAQRFNLSTGAFTLLKKLLQEQKQDAAQAAAALKQYADLLTEMTTVAKPLADILASIGEAQGPGLPQSVASIKVLLAQGKSVEDIAKLYGRLKTEIEAVGKQMA